MKGGILGSDKNYVGILSQRKRVNKATQAKIVAPKKSPRCPLQAVFTGF